MNKRRGLSSRIDFEMASVLFAIGLASLYLFASNYAEVLYSPNEAVIRIVPAQTNWIANGTMQYRVDIILDNSELLESTQAVQYRLQRPQGLGNNITIVGAQYNLSSTQDFFYGAFPAQNLITSAWSTSQVRSSMSGVYNRSGILATYWFIVYPGASPGSYSFTLTNVNVAHDEFTPQAFRVESVPFTIAKPKPATAIGTRAIPCTPGVNC